MAVYTEFAVAPQASAVVACTWEQHPDTDTEQLVVPDGCVDLMWFAGGELMLAGADTRSWCAALPAGRRSTGVRLRPGAAGAFLGVPAVELRDRRVGVEGVRALPGPAVWDRLAERLASADPARQRTILTAVVLRRTHNPDRLVSAAARRLGAPGVRVAAVADELGVSERQLHRRTVAAVGYGPKTLGRVARLQRLLAPPPRPVSLADRAHRAGYASQSHLGDEVRRLTGLTPVRFLEDRGHRLS